MANTKHYLTVSLTLGIIASASALLIAGANLLTEKQIAQNEENSINSAITFIFRKNGKIKSKAAIENKDYTYVNYVYEIDDDDGHGYAFIASGKNMYGKITLIAGFRENGDFVSMKTIVNEQTYTKEVEKFVYDVGEGNRQIDDVSCGATYGAKLVRDMYKEAQKASQEKVWQK